MDIFLLNTEEKRTFIYEKNRKQHGTFLFIEILFIKDIEILNLYVECFFQI